MYKNVVSLIQKMHRLSMATITIDGMHQKEILIVINTMRADRNNTRNARETLIVTLSIESIF